MLPEHQIDDLGPGRLVEISGRLVSDQDCRVGHKRACERNALLLAARELRRIMVTTLQKSDRLEFRCGATVRVPRTSKLQGHGDVFESRHGGDEVE